MINDFDLFQAWRLWMEDRPNMSSVVQMLSSESLLPKQRQPGFYIGSPKAYSSSSTHCSENEITFTLFEAR